MKAPGFRGTVALRRGTSDLLTFRQVLGANEYNLRRLARWQEIVALYADIEKPLILDLGANIGLATLYFAQGSHHCDRAGRGELSVDADQSQGPTQRVKPVNAAAAF